MSPFWVEPRRLLIDADAVSVAEGVARGRRFEYSGSLDVGLDACARALTPKRGSGWQVCIADTLVRYVVVEWPAGLRGKSERDAFVAHRFREVHGIQAPDWRIAAEQSAFDELPALACAIPQTILDALRAWAARHGQSVCGVTGEFADAFNRLRRGFDEPTGAYARMRGGRLTIGVWQEGRWRALRSQAVGEGALVAAIGQFLESRRVVHASSGDAATGVLYCGVAMAGAPAGWRRVRVEEETWG